MAKRQELWTYEELYKISVVKATMETDLETLDKFLAESLHAQIMALADLRRTFENNKSADYLSKAEALYLRQTQKWFNWKLFGCWRDDVDALYLVADYCNRIMEGEYVSEIPYNRAAALCYKAMERCSGKEEQFYRESHRNAVTALKDLQGYPEDNTQKLAEEMALQIYRQIKGIQEPQEGEEHHNMDVSLNQ